MFAKANHRANCGQTYVAKATYDDEDEAQGQKAAFNSFAVGQGLLGAGACAVVELRGETYLVITFEKERSDQTHLKRLKRGCKTFPVETRSGYGR